MVFSGLVLQAIGLGWLALIMGPTTPYPDLVPALVVSGIGMALFFAPTAALVLGTVRRDEEGIASGTANALREVGGVFGVAVLASVFAGHGGYETPATFAAGLQPGRCSGRRRGRARRARAPRRATPAHPPVAPAAADAAPLTAPELVTAAG